MYNSKGERATAFAVGSPIEICVKYKVIRPIQNANFGIGFFGKDGRNYFSTNTAIDGIDTGLVDHNGEYRFCIKACPLMTGVYTLDVAISNKDGFDCDYVKNVLEFKTYSPLSDIGEVFIEHTWKLPQ